MKHSWKDKLDAQGIELVEMARRLRQVKVPGSILDMAEWDKWAKDQKEVYESHPNLGLKRKVKLEREFVRHFLRMHPDIELDESEMMVLFEQEEFPLMRADELELHQRIFLFLESDRDKRFMVYAACASGIVLFRTLFGSSLKQFGTKKLTLFGLFGFAAQNLEWLAKALRGRVRKPPGRENVALAALVDKILEHKKKPLTQVELYEVVKASGAEVPDDPEAFRLWLHRARKQGLVTNYRSTHLKGTNE